MRQQGTNKQAGLHGRVVVITRPAGTATALARRVRALGGVPVLLPGLSLRAMDDVAATRAHLQRALRDDLLIFSSPAAVRYAAALLPLHTAAMVLAVGQGTARALQRHGVVSVLTPPRQDSEGVLALPSLHDPRGRRVTLIGAPGGRGLLRDQLLARGAQLRELPVYRRLPPRLDRRHVDALKSLPPSARVLLSSAEALGNLQALLPPSAWAALCRTTAVVSSDRLAAAAAVAGFAHIVQAASALPDDLLDAAMRPR